MVSLMKYLTRRRPKETPVSPQEQTELTNCITQTKSKIYEDRVWNKKCQGNLVVIARAVSYQLSTLERRGDDIEAAAKAIIRKYAPEPAPRDPDVPITLKELSQISKSIKRLGTQKGTPCEGDEDFLPTVLEDKQLQCLRVQKSDSKAVLQSLILKQAELEVEGRELAAEIIHWAEILKALEFRRLCSEQYPTTRHGVDAAKAVPDSQSRMVSIKRKSVPIEAITEMIAVRYGSVGQSSNGARSRNKMAGASGMKVMEREAGSRGLVAMGDIQRGDRKHDSAIDLDGEYDVYDWEGMEGSW